MHLDLALSDFSFSLRCSRVKWLRTTLPFPLPLPFLDFPLPLLFLLYQRLHVLPNATVQHVQLLRAPQVFQGSLGQLLRTRITRSPRTLPRRLLGPQGTLARLRLQRLGRSLYCSPPPDPDPPHSNHPPHSTRHRQCKPFKCYPYLLGGNLKVYHFWSEGGLTCGGLVVLTTSLTQVDA